MIRIDKELTRRDAAPGNDHEIGNAAYRAQAAQAWPAVQDVARNEGKTAFFHDLRPQGVGRLLIEFRKTNPGIQAEQTRLGRCTKRPSSP